MIDKATLDGMTTADAAKSKRWADTAATRSNDHLHGHAKPAHGASACTAGHVGDIVTGQANLTATDTIIPDELLTASK